MPGPYARWIDSWENRLATRDTNRVVRPFEWGAEWLGIETANGSVREAVRAAAARALADSDAFFSGERPSDYRCDGNLLTFTSPLRTPYPENNVVHAGFFRAPNDRGRAVVVLPQWNGDAQAHAGLCRLLNRFGITALRMSLAYHDRRKPAETARADYHMSSNAGRTIHAFRQSVVDVRACLDWLEQQGYQRLGILGTSLGSCVAFLAAAHDTRIRTGVFNHVSMYTSDVVWTGLSTRHVRDGLAQQATQDEMRDYWAVISPASFVQRLRGRDMKSLLIWARYDTSFLPVYSQQVLAAFRELQLPHKVFALPCAHYTTGRFPFNLMDGLTMCRFLAREL
ncbi:MAG: alpha/beta hydrolase family protein [Bryobacteraceae bacterium]